MEYWILRMVAGITEAFVVVPVNLKSTDPHVAKLQSLFLASSLPVPGPQTGLRRLFAPLGRLWSRVAVRLRMRNAPPRRSMQEEMTILQDEELSRPAEPRIRAEAFVEDSSPTNTRQGRYTLLPNAGRFYQDRVSALA